MTAFLISHNEEGECKVVQIQCKSFLANTISSIPQREMHALSLASQFCRDIVAELGALFDNFLICTDARVTLQWILSDSESPKTIFVENRVQIIKSCAQTCIDLLAEEHGFQNLGMSSKYQPGPPKNFKDVLFWLSGPKNYSDLGTKYLTYDSTCKGHPMLTAEDIDPSLMSQGNLEWMKDIPKSIQEGLLCSARQIQVNNQPLGEDDQKFRSGFKSQGVRKIKELTDIVLEDETGKPKVFEVSTGSGVLAAGDVHEQGDQSDVDHGPLMPSYHEDDNRSFELLALAAQEENMDVRFYERVRKLHNDKAKIRVHKGDKIHEG